MISLTADPDKTCLRPQPFDRVIESMSMEEYIRWIVLCSEKPDDAAKVLRAAADRAKVDLGEKGWWTNDRKTNEAQAAS